MDIKAFREAPLSNKIVAKLVEAAEAIRTLKSACNTSDYKSLQTDDKPASLGFAIKEALVLRDSQSNGFRE